MKNEIAKGKGDYLIQVWREDHSGYWDSYLNNGHILYMNNPARGQWVAMPRGELYEITAFGTANVYNGQKPSEPKQVATVFMKRIEG